MLADAIRGCSCGAAPVGAALWQAPPAGAALSQRTHAAREWVRLTPPMGAVCLYIKAALVWTGACFLSIPLGVWFFWEWLPAERLVGTVRGAK